jgi:putative ABC transport system substrate-binding protein
MVASSRDPVGEGLIRSYARPGGNITGIVTAPQGFTGKQIELLHNVVGGGNPRFGLLRDATTGPLRIDAPTAETTRALGIDLRVFDVLTPDELGAGIAAAAKERVAGLILPGSPMLVANRRQLAESLLKYRLPGISVWRSFAEAGLLMAYGPDLRSEFRRAADYVDKILKGASPADLPVEQPTKFELVINAKTAKALGLTLPPSLLLRADQVIE